MNVRSAGIAVALSLFASRALCWQGSPRVVEIVADHDNRFKLPGQSKQVLVLKANEPLILKITAHRGEESARDGSVHSLVIRSLRSSGWDVRLKEGEQEVPVRAPSVPGTYFAECTVRCGPGHDDMRLKIVVQP